MKIWRPYLRVKAERWPWQAQQRGAFLGRFGGGWQVKLGMDLGWYLPHRSITIILNLVFGLIRISAGLYQEPKVQKGSQA